MRCLGLDLGSKTLGIAISDRTNFIASVYTTLRFEDENYYSLIEPLREIINKEEITGRNLVTENYLVNSIINPFDSTTDITDNVKIEISLTNDYSVSSVIVKNSSNEQINCDSNAW